MIYRIKEQEGKLKRQGDKVVLESKKWGEIKIALANINKSKIKGFAYVVFGEDPGPAAFII